MINKGQITTALIRLTIIISVFLSLASTAFSETQDYIVGEGDVLKLTVYEHEDLTLTVRVSGEGSINVPLIGDIRTKGLTLAQIAQNITELLADGYIVNPQVSIFIHEFKSNKATILGQINRPGLYELQQHTTLLEIISQAGGLTPLAGSKVTIKRESGSGSERQEETINIDLKKLIEGGDTTFNIQIVGGDSIYIASPEVYYVTGEVKSPNAYNLNGEITVIQAVTKAGGFTAKGAPSKIKIIRKTDDGKKVLKRVSMNTLVLPDDVIVVPESFF